MSCTAINVIIAPSFLVGQISCSFLIYKRGDFHLQPLLSFLWVIIIPVTLFPEPQLLFLPHTLFIPVVWNHSEFASLDKLPFIPWPLRGCSCCFPSAWWLLIAPQNPAQAHFLLWDPLCEWHISTLVYVISVQNCLCSYLLLLLNFKLLGIASPRHCHSQVLPNTVPDRWYVWETFAELRYKVK